MLVCVGSPILQARPPLAESRFGGYSMLKLPIEDIETSAKEIGNRGLLAVLADLSEARLTGESYHDRHATALASASRQLNMISEASVFNGEIETNARDSLESHRGAGSLSAGTHFTGRSTPAMPGPCHPAR